MVFLKIIKTLRNHWKKSTFGFVVLSYGVNYTKNKYDTNVLMRAYCEEAAKYGNEPLSLQKESRSITVILNPAANKRKAKSEYERFCEPLFHLAGINVNLLQTNAEGHAKELVENLPENETIVIAGGDGTLCETITGILRKNEKNPKNTIGIIPLGKRNYVGNKLFPLNANENRIHQLTFATFTIIKNESKLQDVMKIEALETETEFPGKPIFAFGPIEWGAFRDTFSRRDKYWFYGGFRDYAAFVFNGYKSSLCWDCKGTLKYSPPCNGCNNCRKYLKKQTSFSWVNFLMPKTVDNDKNIKFVNITNEDCNSVEEICFKSVEVDIVPTEGNENSPPSLNVLLHKMNIGYFQFVKEGWKKINNYKYDMSDSIKAREIELIPLQISKPENQIWFNFDNEEFDVKPVKITLLPGIINVYCV